MPGPTTEFLSDEIREVRDGFLKLSVGLAEVRTEVRVFSGIVGAVGVLTISGIISSIWWAATLNSRVGVLESKVGEVNARLDKVEGGMRAGFEGVDARLDRLEASIAKALAKP